MIYIHVPKAAGVSISRALYGRPLGHFTAADIRQYCPSVFDNLFTFGVVRHPVDRLYSAYRFACAGGTEEMGIKNPKTYQAESFVSFDKFVCEWLPEQDLTNIDGVFRPQYLYLCDDNEVIVDKVIRLEDMDQELKKLSALIGREIILGHYNKLPVKPLVVESSDTLAIINYLYQKDFNIFSYSRGKRA